MSFTMEEVEKYIERIQKESYCLTSEYWKENQNEEWYLKSVWRGESYTMYSHPCVPYIHIMECRDEEEDQLELLDFLKKVFLSHKLNVEQTNKELMVNVAKDMYDKLF